MTFLIYYLIFISIVSGYLFYFDKVLSKKGSKRIAELVLHIFELLGGIFINLILMYTIRHKNKKKMYKFVSFLVLLLWLFLLLEFIF